MAKCWSFESVPGVSKTSKTIDATDLSKENDLAVWSEVR